jgi:hypothetical protein
MAAPASDGRSADGLGAAQLDALEGTGVLESAAEPVDAVTRPAL